MKIMRLGALLLLSSLLLNVVSSNAEVCIKATSTKSKGKIVTKLKAVTRSGACKSGEVSALSGPQGATGATGEDGAIKVYGDGSAGPLNVLSTISWNSSPPTGYNLQFTDCTVPSGVTLTVPSGTVIRCTGSVTIAGTITVSSGADGGQQDYDSSGENLADPMNVPAGVGIALRGAASGEFIDANSATDTLEGGLGGEGMNNLLQASFITKQYLLGGGGGAATSADDTDSSGGRGGGAFGIYAKGGITISGAVNAKGASAADDGCGGGGGGVVVLASQTSVAFSGTGAVDVSGGNGGASSTSRGAGAGGGGGVIIYAAPVGPTIDGTNSIVTAGTAGSDTTNVTQWPRQAGGGGGASGGDGGDGGDVQGDGTASPANAAAAGRALALPFDPTALLF